MIKIKENTYKRPTEVREEVVQAICEAFLWRIDELGRGANTFHPFHGNNRGTRNAHKYVTRHKREHNGMRFKTDGKYEGFSDGRMSEFDEGMKFNGAEMKRAFDELIKAGYYMFRVYEYGEWMGYKCSAKPFLQGGEMVKTFNDFID